ncbi:MAG TPA: hypothetical protein VHI13_12770 [Candidatus Kapabacteria bacterium]|nr:hypothetical protein [Candidatus Kapabacteria bacterium]
MKHIYSLAIIPLAAVLLAGCFSATRIETDTYTITQRDTTIRENMRNVPGERDNGTIYPTSRSVEIKRNYVNRDSVVNRYYPAFLRFGGIETAGFIGTGGSTQGSGNGLFGLYRLLNGKYADSTKFFTGYMYRIMPYEVRLRAFDDDPNWTFGTAAFETFINQRDSSAVSASNESLMGVLPIYVRHRFFLRDKPPYVMVVPFLGLGLIPSQYVNLGATLDVGSIGGFNIRAYAGFVTGTHLLFQDSAQRALGGDVSFPYVGLGVSALDFVNRTEELKVEWKDHHHNAIEVAVANLELAYSTTDSAEVFGSKKSSIGSFPTGITLRFASASVNLPVADHHFFVGTSLFNLMALSKAEIAFGFLPLRVGYRKPLIGNDLNLEPFAEYTYYPSTAYQIGVKASMKIYDWTQLEVTAAYAHGSPNLDVLTGFEDLKSLGDFSTFYLGIGFGLGDVFHTVEEVERK